MFEEVFPEKKRKGPGMPASHPRNIMNPLLYIFAAGRRRCGLPKGRQWASKSSARRRHQTWQSDGAADGLKAGIPGAAQNEG